ncbi:uncharacterized protein [Rutidosis leptorrhynchoides]|uniref:uncharacterized protein n=1 Tax=Rutidosis leptorrhynchoides TaxID=125765 RepID=UPI003A98D08D
MSTQDTLIIRSDTRPPVLFDGKYYQWLHRITQYIDYKETGLPIPVYELTGERRERAKGDMEAKNIIMQAISYELFENVDSNTSAKDIWDEIRRQQEGYDMTNVTKLNNALGLYEDFKQEPDELLNDNYRRFNGVMNELKKCKIIKVNAEINMKFLKKLNSDWIPYV